MGRTTDAIESLEAKIDELIVLMGAGLPSALDTDSLKVKEQGP